MPIKNHEKENPITSEVYEIFIACCSGLTSLRKE
jgi:hypothetical protein